MRSLTLVLTLAMAAASFALLPAAEAAQPVCTVQTHDGCGGWACVGSDGDAYWSDGECVSKSDLDRCRYQSDCCSSTGLWCPDRE